MNSNAIPAKITSSDLYTRAGSNRLPELVVFSGNVFNGTEQFEDDPLASIDAYGKAVYSKYEEVERKEKFEGYTGDEMRVALAEVLNRIEGFVSRVVKTSPIDKPATRRVPIGYNKATGEMDYKVVPEGAASLPFRGNAWIRIIEDSSGTPYVAANVMRGDQTHLEGIFGFVRDWADTNSIYVNQAIDTNFQFIDLTKVDPTKVAMTEEMKLTINTYVNGPLMYRDALDAKRQDPKTAVLLEGPPGGGKTVTLSLCQAAAITRGGIVIHVDPAMGIYGLDRADKMATRLEGAGHMVMICFEDIENLAKESRPKMLEILDGAKAKNSRRIIMGTTNFIDRIDRAALRHGRFDHVLHCGLPDRSAFEQMIRVLIDADDLGEVDYDFMFPYFEGYSYATIANAASKVIRMAINRLEGDLTNFKVTTEDLVNAAKMVRRQHDLMQSPVELQPKDFEAHFKQIHVGGGDRGWQQRHQHPQR